MENPRIFIKDLTNLLGMTTAGILSKLNKNNISPKKFRGKYYLTHENTKNLFKIVSKKKTISFFSSIPNKSQFYSMYLCGKCLNSYGAKVLLIDLTKTLYISRELLKYDQIHSSLADIVIKNGNIKDGIINLVPGLDIIPGSFTNLMIPEEFHNDVSFLPNKFSKHLNHIKEKYDFILVGHNYCHSRALLSMLDLCDETIIHINSINEFSYIESINSREIIENLEKKLKNEFPYLQSFLVKGSPSLINNNDFLKRIPSQFHDVRFIEYNSENFHNVEKNFLLPKNLTHQESIEDFVFDLLNLENSFNLKHKKIELNVTP